MERNELIAQMKPRWDAFFASPPPPEEISQYTVRTTSGTTTGKPILLLNRAGPHASSRFGSSQKVLMCMGSLNVRLSHVRHAWQVSGENPLHVLPLSGDDLGEPLTMLFADFAPDQLYGISGFAGRAAAYIDSMTARGIRDIWLCGEGLSHIIEQRFRTLFPHSPIRMEYIVTELGGAIGVSCGNLPPNTYHPAANIVMEIADQDETGAGEILVTKKVNEHVFATKYRTGDTVRIVNTPCPCGNPITFEHLGRRGYDYIKIAGAVVRKEEFDRGAALFKKFIDEYRADVGEKLVDGKILGTVVLRVFRKDGPVTAGLAQQIGRDFSRAVFLTPTQTYADLVAQGLFLPLIVEFSAHAFPQKNKDIKLFRLRS